MQLDSLSNVKEPTYSLAKLPPDITDLTGEQLAEMFTILTGWADYFATKLLHAQLEERAAEKKLDRHVASLTVSKLGSATKADKVTLIKAQIACDETTQDLEDAYEALYATRKAWELMLNNQERDITLVSREITRRTSELRRGI